MRRCLGAMTLAALIAMSASTTNADDRRDWGPRGQMGPSYGMGPGMMGPGMMAQGMVAQGMGCGMGQGMMGPAGMRGYAGRPPIDTDHDGIVSSTEAAGHFDDAFAAIDGDDDGKLTLEEFSSVYFGPGPRMAMHGDGMQQWQERKETRFKEIDADKDGSVTQEEFIAYGKKRFEDSDRDKNGKVTVWEFRGRRHF